MSWRALKPSVPRPWLIALAGVLWCAVGAMLWARAIAWSLDLHSSMVLAVLPAVVLGVVAHATMFLRIARKNLVRLRALPPRPCIFAFQAWRGYLVIAFMIGLGIALRYSPIPRHTLAVLYGAIGTALILSGAVVGKAALSDV
jgi:hypothetical protein